MALWILRAAAPLALARATAASAVEDACPGSIAVTGLDEPVSLVPAGWGLPGGLPELLEVDSDRGTVAPGYGSRGYFAASCAAGSYDRGQYTALNLLGKTLRYMVNLSGAGCGCNAGFSLVPMAQSVDKGACGDYYCDANAVCGNACAEIGIQEANHYAWHSTLRSASDHDGTAAGYGGSGPAPRDFTGLQYGPGGMCVDTSEPFAVAASFPVDSSGSLMSVEVVLSQDDHSCPLNMKLDRYAGMSELESALAAGVTPVVSYWGSEGMQWLDGAGPDGKGPCVSDHSSACPGSVLFSQFSVEALKAAGAGGESVRASLRELTDAPLGAGAGVVPPPGDWAPEKIDILLVVLTLFTVLAVAVAALAFWKAKAAEKALADVRWSCCDEAGSPACRGSQLTPIRFGDSPLAPSPLRKGPI